MELNEAVAHSVVQRFVPAYRTAQREKCPIKKTRHSSFQINCLYKYIIILNALA